MRDFDEIRQETKLEKFLDSPLGTLYIISNALGVPKTLVRHFDNQLPASQVRSFVELIQAVRKWIEQYPELALLVRVEPVIEVGKDFVARSFHIYYASTDAYVDWENPPEPPKELERMRAMLRTAIDKLSNPRDVIIGRVLSRSLLEPTGKTYFDENKGQFIVVEPSLTREDVERWSALSAPTDG